MTTEDEGEILTLGNSVDLHIFSQTALYAPHEAATLFPIGQIVFRFSSYISQMDSVCDTRTVNASNANKI